MSQPVGPSKPTIGRIVHVVLEPIVVPAIVTAVLSDDGDIAATAFPPGSPPLPIEVSHREPGPTSATHAGTWHWPPIR